MAPPMKRGMAMARRRTILAVPRQSLFHAPEPPAERGRPLREVVERLRLAGMGFLKFPGFGRRRRQRLEQLRQTFEDLHGGAELEVVGLEDTAVLIDGTAQGVEVGTDVDRVCRPGCVDALGETGDGLRHLPHGCRQFCVTRRLLLARRPDPGCKAGDCVEGGAQCLQVAACLLIRRGHLPHRGHQLRVACRPVLRGGLEPDCNIRDRVQGGLQGLQLAPSRLLRRLVLRGDEGRALADRGEERIERLPVSLCQARCGSGWAKKIRPVCHGSAPRSCHLRSSSP